MSPKKQTLLAVLFTLAFSPLIYFGVSYQSEPKAQQSAMKSVCRDEIMAIAPEGESVLKLPEGWKYLDNMDGLILVQREVCE